MVDIIYKLCGIRDIIKIPCGMADICRNYNHKQTMLGEGSALLGVNGG
jgi:hypothetical protein